MSNLPDLPALSIRQPWASLIVMGWKDVENRTWRTRFRGQFLVHASSGLTGPELHEAKLWVAELAARERIAPSVWQWLAPQTKWTLPRGCIIGMATVVDCVDESASPWFAGPHGFALACNVHRWPKPMACKGALGFFRPEVAR